MFPRPAPTSMRVAGNRATDAATSSTAAAARPGKPVAAAVSSISAAPQPAPHSRPNRYAPANADWPPTAAEGISIAVDARRGRGAALGERLVCAARPTLLFAVPHRLAWLAPPVNADKSPTGAAIPTTVALARPGRCVAPRQPQQVQHADVRQGFAVCGLCGQVRPHCRRLRRYLQLRRMRAGANVRWRWSGQRVRLAPDVQSDDVPRGQCQLRLDRRRLRWSAQLWQLPERTILRPEWPSEPLRRSRLHTVPQAQACSGHCGPTADGCGNVYACGGCPSGQVCGAGGDGVCGTPPDGGTACTPASCEGARANCGSLGDGCGGAIRAAHVPRIRPAASVAPTNAGRPVASLYLKSKRVAANAARWPTAAATFIRAVRAAQVNFAEPPRATCAVYRSVGARRSRASPRMPTAGLSAMGAEARSNAVAVLPGKPAARADQVVAAPPRPRMHPHLVRRGRCQLWQGGRWLRWSHRLWHLLDARYLWRRWDRQHLWSPKLRPGYLRRRARELRPCGGWLRRRPRLRHLHRSPVVRRGRGRQPVWRRQLHTGHLRRGLCDLRAHRRWLREHVELRDLRGA